MPIKHIKTSKKTRLTDTDGVEYRKVRLAALTVDHRFCRRGDWRRHKRFRTAFRRRLAGTVTCVKYAGKLLVIDGLERVRQARASGLGTMVVQVVTGLTDAEIHGLFVVSNGDREVLTAFDRFRHLFHAGNPAQRQIVARAKIRWFHIPLGVGEKRNTNSLACYDAMVAIYDRYGVIGIDNLFDTLKACFVCQPKIAGLEAKARTAELLTALAGVLSSNRWTFNQVIATLKQQQANANSIHAEGVARSKAAGHSTIRYYTFYIENVLLDVLEGRKWLRMTQLVPPYA